ncbi:hypothetical protein FAZ19_01940 [Sphingobacterium alkalisoli]|uniref:Asparagine synthetase domain-containing protein n=1 Tax=Sphingobacterium alkalisoli TaxID=1874115 RepID=A0A4U0H9I4_9SPHI|nr:hypothetical protein [Sphingobacterium alkalisoli]TJY68044.1 hypothetical protein FAZ19_01940 [Sphingobacterium alkalisoli]GGH09448.1 hypothetical protein GCM10011418_07440 [Sphingobacterium alkalisoli]
MELIKGDWVGFNTIFYHEKTGKFSKNISDVIDYGNIEIDKEGLSAYLDYGYSVFGYTPVKYVKFLLPFQSLQVKSGTVEVCDNEDETVHKIGITTKEEFVIEKIEDNINSWASTFPEDIIIPTSGGFDSRFLNMLVKDKSRIHAYTYGTSFNQNKSRETVYAKLLSDRLGIKWTRINLEKFNSYTDEWYAIFGPSAGASGTYHIEFFEKIFNIEKSRLCLLSGIIGDAWAGAVNISPVSDLMDYKVLGHTHGMNADYLKATGVDYSSIIEPIYDKQKDNLKDPDYRIIATMRTKMMLLKFLISIPQRYNFEGYSPFLEEDIALAMLNLPKDRKHNRIWQRDFFKRHNVLFEEEKHSYTYQNSLNYDVIKKHGLKPLNIQLLKEHFKKDYIEWVNRKISGISAREAIFQTLMHTPKIKGMMKMLRFKNELMAAYFAYITIKPIENLLNLRNESAKS